MRHNILTTMIRTKVHDYSRVIPHPSSPIFAFGKSSESFPKILGILSNLMSFHLYFFEPLKHHVRIVTTFCMHLNKRGRQSTHASQNLCDGFQDS